MSQFSPAAQYEKVTKEIIRYVIINLPDGVRLARGMRDSKLPKIFLDTKPKQEKKPCGASAVDEDEYKLEVLEWKENSNIHI